MSTDRPTTWRLTLKHPDGQPMLTLVLEEDRPPESRPSPTPIGRAQTVAPAKESRPGSAPADGDSRMTEPQRRYLFRLLAVQGVEGRKAEDHLKEYFSVRALRDVSKSAASQLIDQMVTDQKDGANGTA